MQGSCPSRIGQETALEENWRSGNARRMSPKPGADSLSLFDDPPAGPDLALEDALMARGARHVAGVDEAGRGPLAGPVVAAAVILDPANIPEGLDDSKKLTQARREALFGQITATALVAWSAAGPREIDLINIRQATLAAMTRAVEALSHVPCRVLVDGRDVPPLLSDRGRAIIRGDGRSLSIAAASIVAKVVRDRFMSRAALLHPGYGFERHKGYGSRDHLEAIARLGPSPMHRMSFAPLKEV